MALTEGALDLSAPKAFDSKPTSPTHSYASDADCRADRPSSVVSSDADDPALMSPRRKRPALAPNGGGFSPRGYPTHPSPRASPELSPRSGGSVASTPRSSPATSASPAGHGVECSPASTLASPTAAASGNTGSSSSYPPGAGLSPTGTSRPFKLYPFEPLPSMYSQLAAAASQGMYAYGSAGPTTPGAMTPAMNLFDSAISLSSPIGQYLQQKKRRLETRENSKIGLSGLPSPPAGPQPPSGYMSGGDDSSNHSMCGSMDMGDKKIKSVPEDKKDEAYWERRRKNNEAAKRSRDARRAKEEEIALRAAFLEQENLKLRAQVAILKNETAKLHYMLYNRM